MLVCCDLSGVNLETQAASFSFACLLRPLGLQDQLFKLENFGWCRDRPYRALPYTCPDVNNLLKNENGKKRKLKKVKNAKNMEKETK